MKKNHIGIALTLLFFAGAVVGLGLVEYNSETHWVVTTKTNEMPNNKFYGFTFYEEPASFVSYQK
jgi:hypothetical protein